MRVPISGMNMGATAGRQVPGGVPVAEVLRALSFGDPAVGDR